MAPKKEVRTPQQTTIVKKQGQPDTRIVGGKAICGEGFRGGRSLPNRPA